jgi:hypothetical protein
MIKVRIHESKDVSSHHPGGIPQKELLMAFYQSAQAGQRLASQEKVYGGKSILPCDIEDTIYDKVVDINIISVIASPTKSSEQTESRFHRRRGPKNLSTMTKSLF